MATQSSYRKLGYLGVFGFLGLFGLAGRPEMMPLVALFGLFALFFTPTVKEGSGNKSPSRGAIILAGCIAMLVLAIVAAQYGFARRTVRETVLVPQLDVNIYAQHVDEIANASEVITELKVDRLTNTIIVSAQSRNLDAASEEVRDLIRDPAPVLAASSLGVSVGEARAAGSRQQRTIHAVTETDRGRSRDGRTR